MARLFRPHIAYAAIALVATVPYLLTLGSWVNSVWFALIGLSAGAAIVVGVRRHRPATKVAWLCFAAGVSLNAAGPLVEVVSGNVFHVTLSYPGIAEAFYLSLYPGLIVGLALLIRRRTRQRDWATLVDSTTISTGLGLLSWVFVIRPVAEAGAGGLLGQVIAVAYPIGDVVLLAMVVRLMLGRGSRNVAFRLMAAALLLTLAGDAAWATIGRIGWMPDPQIASLLYGVFLVGFVLFGVAALHPSMRQVEEPSEQRVRRLSPAVLAVLTLASLIAPGILAIEVARGEVVDGVAIVVGSVALFLLVVTRMAQLLREVESQAIQLSQLVQVDELTGLPNRRAWKADLPRAIERARRDGTPLSIAMIDLDHFKRFNDEYGHPAGDRLLRGASAAWRQQLRAVDELARYGGEEFIALLPTADSVEATTVLERLRTVTPAGQTFSAGVASWSGVETSEELVTRADQALYQAKAEGRDRVAIAPDRRLAAQTG